MSEMTGGVGGIGMIGGVGGLGMAGGTAGSPARGNAAGASAVAQSSGTAATSSLPDVTVNISEASKAALAADTRQATSTSAVQPPTAGNKTDGVPVNDPNDISNAELQNLLRRKEQNNLVTELLLAILLQQMQNK